MNYNIDDMESEVLSLQKQLDDEKTKLGIGGFPGLQERFIEALEYARRVSGHKMSSDKEYVLENGYLAGASAFLNIIQEIQSHPQETQSIELESVMHELTIMCMKQEIKGMQAVLRRINDEG